MDPFSFDMKNRFKLITHNLKIDTVTLKDCLQMPFLWDAHDALSFIEYIDQSRMSGALIDRFKKRELLVFKRDWSAKMPKNTRKYLIYCQSNMHNTHNQRKRVREESRSVSNSPHYDKRPRLEQSSPQNQPWIDNNPIFHGMLSPASSTSSGNSLIKNALSKNGISQLDLEDCEKPKDREIARYHHDQLGSLVHFIRNMRQHWGQADEGTLLDKVKNELGERPDKFLETFTHKFPQLISILYVCACRGLNCHKLFGRLLIKQNKIESPIFL